VPEAEESKGAPGTSRRWVCFAVPLLLTLHNLEEALGFEQTRQTLAEQLPASAVVLLPETSSLYLALGIATLVPWVLWAASLKRPRPWSDLLVLVQCLMLANALWHVGAACMLGAYSPGLGTALLLNLPFSLYLVRRVRRERWVSPRRLRSFVVGGLAVHAFPALLLVWLMARPR
jgi:hypothetical protein